MNILIKGMKMPTEGKVMTIYKLKGGFYASLNGTELYPLVELPDHGDLLDKDELSMLVGESFEYFLARLGLKCPKAIIPAERSEDGLIYQRIAEAEKLY